MGHTIGARIQPGTLNGTPPLFPSLCYTDKSNEDQRHCSFQAPVHHQPRNLTRILRGRNSPTTSNGPQRQYTSRQLNGRGIDQSEQIIYKNSSGKTSSNSGKRTANQTQGRCDNPNHSHSKGGQTTSKGEQTTSKGGRTKPKNGRATSQSGPRDTFPPTDTAKRRTFLSVLAKLHITG